MKPYVGYIQVEPEVSNAFVASVKGTYDEVGKIVALPEDYSDVGQLKVGMKVFFDSWQAAKFPIDDKGTLYWYIPFDAVKAYGTLSTQ